MIHGIILSAGKSERMGSVKALIKRNDKTFIKTIIDNFKKAGIENIVVVLGFNREKIEEEISSSNVKIIYNPNPEEGQISSLKCALRELADNGVSVIVQLVDIPDVCADTICELLRIQRNNPEKIIIPAYSSLKGHPVIFPAKLIYRIINYESDKSARDFITEHEKDVMLVNVKDENILKNYNTLKDLK